MPTERFLRISVHKYRQLVRKHAIIVSPRRAAYIIAKARQPVMIVGIALATLRLPRVDLVSYVVELAQMKDMVIFCSRSTEPVLRGRYDKVIGMNLFELAFRVCELGKLEMIRRSDLVVLIGHREDVLYSITSAFKHYISSLNTLCIDRFYCPNTTYSFPTLELGMWDRALLALIEHLRRFVGTQHRE